MIMNDLLNGGLLAKAQMPGERRARGGPLGWEKGSREEEALNGGDVMVSTNKHAGARP